MPVVALPKVEYEKDLEVTFETKYEKHMTCGISSEYRFQTNFFAY
jgi:hypothetical protein